MVDSKREMSSEYQLEKSISSHGKDETRTRSQKRQQSKQNKNQRKKKRQLDNRIRAHNFDAFEADYVDFGAVIGQGGAFSWHANYSPEWDGRKDKQQQKPMAHYSFHNFIFTLYIFHVHPLVY